MHYICIMCTGYAKIYNFNDFEVLDVCLCCVLRLQGWGELWGGPTHRHHHRSGHAEQPSLQVLQDQYDPQTPLHHRSPAGYDTKTLCLCTFTTGSRVKLSENCQINAFIHPSMFHLLSKFLFFLKSTQEFLERRWKSTRSPARKPQLSSGLDRSPSPLTRITCVPAT